MKAGLFPAVLMGAWMVAVTSGCTGAGQPARPDQNASRAAGAPSAGSEQEQRQLREQVATALQPRPATETLSGAVQYARAADGSTLVVVGSNGKQTTYRVFDARWRPLTPLLEVDVDLRVERGLQDGFLVGADRTGAPGTRLSALVTMSADGSMQAVVPGTDDAALHRTDVLFNAPGGAGWVQAYRPSTREVWRPPREAFARPGRMTWLIDSTGRVCDHPYLFEKRALTYASRDGGFTWKTVRLDRVLPPTTPRELQPCYLVHGRLVVGAGEVESVDNVYVVDVHHEGSGPETISSSEVDDLDGSQFLDVLPDGRAVLRARAGVLVATDPMNTSFELHEVTLPRSGFVSVLESDILLFLGSAKKGLAVSRDPVRIWRHVDLLGLDERAETTD